MKENHSEILYPINLSPDQILEFRRLLLDWYDANKRDLPWRSTKDPYKIWVSEIMLQQTQVDTVIPYYENFITHLPTVQDLARASEDLLMSLWQGLGYYSRVRNMQTAAKQVMEDWSGQMPDTLEGLLTLKGIGPYTAGAIASMAFDRVEPAIDGNLMRVFSRLFEVEEDISKAKSKKIFQSIGYQLIDPQRPGDFNQALMDLGATIMTPTNYQPSNNPLASFDQSAKNGTSHLYPVKKSKTKVSEHFGLAYLISNPEGEWLMRRHQEGELLRGLWHFPLIERDIVLESASPKELIEAASEWYNKESKLLLEESPLELDSSYLGEQSWDQLDKRFPPVKHVFSHRIWHLQIIPTKLKSNKYQIENQEDLKWISPDQITNLPHSTLQEKLFSLVKRDDR
ncbi:A/G-specific adenine glycosylase [Hutsoniella sourekii]|uniref:A/G-specific adenine glycosylase n=1 Tax=Hutsoniella sourekii TaxID=87650 RepID=UPI0004B6F60E|nr:A/G-specific adenine glycosylase [Hutsoniella sourekii]